MGYVIKMPQLGMEMERGTVLEWKIAEDESISEGDVVAEVESEKSIADVEAREDGVLRRVYVREGETVPPGTAIGILAAPDADVADLEADAEASLEDARPDSDGDTAGAETAGEPRGSDRASAAAETDTSSRDTGGGTAVKASPRAEKRAEELGIELEAVEGTGPGGAITADDVEAAEESETEETGEPESPARPADGSVRPGAGDLDGSRYGRETAVIDPEATEALLDATNTLQDEFDVDVTTTDVLLVALSATLVEHPTLNATFEESTHHLYGNQHVGLTLESEGDLPTPVVADVGERSLAELVRARRDASGPGNDDERDEESPAATFTLANAIESANEDEDGVVEPLDASPTVASLMVSPIRQRATPVADGDGVDVRPYTTVALIYDSRAVDTDGARRCLDTLCENVGELPELVAERL